MIIQRMPVIPRHVKSTAARSLRDLYIDELRHIYWSECAMMRAFPKLISNSTSDILINILTAHSEVTRKQLARLIKAFAYMGEDVAGENCEAMTGLVKGCEQTIIETEKGIVRDAGIVAALQKMKHFEIASYGTLHTLARTLGERKSAAMMMETLKEEREADALLCGISDSFIQTMESILSGKTYNIFDEP